MVVVKTEEQRTELNRSVVKIHPPSLITGLNFWVCVGSKCDTRIGSAQTTQKQQNNHLDVQRLCLFGGKTDSFWLTFKTLLMTHTLIHLLHVNTHFSKCDFAEESNKKSTAISLSGWVTGPSCNYFFLNVTFSKHTQSFSFLLMSRVPQPSASQEWNELSLASRPKLKINQEENPKQPLQTSDDTIPFRKSYISLEVSDLWV